MKAISSALLIASLAAAPAQAQHVHPAGQAAASGIKALTPEEVTAYLDGDGMGLAKAAELNHYPGPKHALELADELKLSPDQRSRITAIRQQIVAAGKTLGRTIIDRETELDRLFASGAADHASVARLTSEIGSLQGELRATHLNAHIAMRALLTRDQITTYDQRRGND